MYADITKGLGGHAVRKVVVLSPAADSGSPRTPAVYARRLKSYWHLGLALAAAASVSLPAQASPCEVFAFNSCYIGVDGTNTQTLSTVDSTLYNFVGLGVSGGDVGITPPAPPTGPVSGTLNVNVGGSMTLAYLPLTIGAPTFRPLDNSVLVGVSAGASGTLNVNGGSINAPMLVAGQTDNARPSTGTVSISNGGTFTATFDSGPTGVLPGNPAVGIGRGLGSTGIVNVDGTGSQLIAANGMFSIGRLGSGALNVTNGGQVVAGGTVFGSTVGPTGSSSILVDGTGSKLNAGSNDILLGINNDLNPANTNHGTATLNVRNGGEVTGNVTLGQGGTLRGNGTVTGNVLNQGGTIQPGNSPGTLHVLGNYTQNKGIIEIEVAGASAFDVLDVSMDVALDDVLIRFIFTGGYSPLAGDTYEFLKSGTGSISNLNPLYEVFGLQPGFDYTVGGGQNGLTLVAINNGVAVPEPGSLALLAIAFLGLVSVRGRTRT